MLLIIAVVSSSRDKVNVFISGLFSSLSRNANHNAGNDVQIVCDRGKDLSAFAARSICSRSPVQTRKYIRKWIEIRDMGHNKGKL